MNARDETVCKVFLGGYLSICAGGAVNIVRMLYYRGFRGKVALLFLAYAVRHGISCGALVFIVNTKYIGKEASVRWIVWVVLLYTVLAKLFCVRKKRMTFKFSKYWKSVLKSAAFGLFALNWVVKIRDRGMEKMFLLFCLALVLPISILIVKDINPDVSGPMSNEKLKIKEEGVLLEIKKMAEHTNIGQYIAYYMYGRSGAHEKSVVISERDTTTVIFLSRSFAAEKSAAEIGSTVLQYFVEHKRGYHILIAFLDFLIIGCFQVVYSGVLLGVFYKERNLLIRYFVAKEGYLLACTVYSVFLAYFMAALDKEIEKEAARFYRSRNLVPLDVLTDRDFTTSKNISRYCMDIFYTYTRKERVQNIIGV